MGPSLVRSREERCAGRDGRDDVGGAPHLYQDSLAFHGLNVVTPVVSTSTVPSGPRHIPWISIR